MASTAAFTEGNWIWRNAKTGQAVAWPVFVFVCIQDR